MQNTALHLTEANKISLFMVIKITPTSHIFKFCFFHNEYKMKPINFAKWQMAAIC